MSTRYPNPCGCGTVTAHGLARYLDEAAASGDDMTLAARNVASSLRSPRTSRARAVRGDPPPLRSYRRADGAVVTALQVADDLERAHGTDEVLAAAAPLHDPVLDQQVPGTMETCPGGPGADKENER